MADVTPGAVQPLPAAFRHLSPISDHNTTAARTDFAHSHAILIGINDYANGIQRLATATHDAQVLAELLESQHGYQVQRFTTAVSKATLTELFTQHLPATIQADDRLLVYFAGHGIALDGEDGPAGYLIPQDARPEAPDSFLAMRDFNQWLSQLRCRHLLVILDCCFAGAFRWASTRNLKPLPDKLYRERFERFIRDPAWQVLTSAAYDQKALDFLTGNSLGERGQQNGHSPFAQALFAALAGKGDLVPAGGDGVITATELYLYLRDFVEVAAEQQAHHRQTPGLWPLQKHDKGEFIFFVPGQAVTLEPAPTLTTENNPYRGLASYDYSAKDARLFFGRTKLIDELATLVEQHGLTLVLGASGTGKSSLVKAGLLPKLHPPGAAGAAGAATWQVLPPIRPTDQPLRVLHHLLTHQLADGQAGEMLADLSRLTEALVKLVDDWCQAHAGQRLLLMVDQLEELITLCRNDAERTAFLALLAALLHSQPNQLRIVLTLRSDFEPQFAKSLLFTQPTQPVARFIVPPLSQDELREVIEGPAAASTLFFEDSQLVDDLINEVVQTPGALPLLSFTLEQLYLRYLKRQEAGQEQGITIDRALTRADYHALGGVIGSLNQRASEEYDNLPDDAHRATLQRVMLRMVAVEGGEVARRRVPRRELIYPNASENERIEHVIQRLEKARLVVSGQADTDGDGEEDRYVEPAHDALVRAWDMLLTWRQMAESRLPLSLHRELTRAATRWQQTPQNDKIEFLWHNEPRLPLIEAALWHTIEVGNDSLLVRLWQTLFPHGELPNTTTQLNAMEATFVQQSTLRRAFVLRRLIAVITAVVVVLAGLGFATLLFQRTAQQERAAKETEQGLRTQVERLSRYIRGDQLATQAQNVLKETPHLSILLALEAISATVSHAEPRTPSAEQALRDALARNVGISLGNHADAQQPVAWHPARDYLATITADTLVQVWHTKTKPPTVITELTQTHQLDGIVWSPAGQALAVYGGDQLSIWTFDAMMTASTPLVLNHPGVSGIEWAQDGRSVMSMGDGKFRIWNLSAESPAVARLDLPYNTWPNRFDWSSSGERVANVSSEGELQIWELTSENPAENPRTLPQSSVSSIAWSPDGTQLASADAESLVIWDLRTNQPLVFHYPPDYSYPPEMLEWSPDGSWLAAGVRQGGDVLLWSLAAGPSASDPLQLPHLQWSLGWITWSPDSKRVAFFSGNPMMLMAAVIVWDLSGEAPTSVTLSNGDGVDVRQLTNIAWAWDSIHLAGGSPDGTVRIWNLSKDDPNANPVILFKERAVSAVHWSADGQWLVGSGEGNTRLWHLATGYPNADPTFITLDDHTDDVGSQSTWAPTANRLAVSNNETVTMWDQHPDYSWSAFITLNHESSVYGHQIEWSSNLTRLASVASNSDQVWVWDLSLDDPAAHAVIVPHPSEVSDIAWSSNNQSLAISGKDGSLQIWHATTDRFGAVQLRTDPIPDLDPYELYDLDWSPDGTHVSRTVSDTVWIWDLSAAQPNRQPIRLPHTNKVRAAEWSPDSQRIAAVGVDNAILVWALPVGEPMSATIQLQQTPTDYTFPDTVVDPEVSLAWSPDGRWLASKNINLLQLWDLNAANPVTASILFAHEAPITALAWHPHEPYLATSSGHMLTDGQPNAEVKIQVWSLLEEEPIRQPIVLLQNEKLTSPLKLAWLADDSALVGWDQSSRQIRRWTMVQQQLIDLGCRAAGRNLSQAEWNRYFQGEAYRQTCPQWAATEQPIINH